MTQLPAFWRRGLRFVLLLASPLAIGQGLAAQSEPPQPGHWSCQSAIVDNTIYSSAVFDAAALMNEVQTGFQQFLAAKYGFKNQVFCGRADMSGSTLAGLEAGVKDRDAQLRNSGKQVVETGWTFTPASARLPYVCSGAVTVRKAGQTQGLFYVTGVLEMPGSVVSGLKAAWHDYLNGLHPGFLINPEICNLMSADPATRQTQLNSMVDQWKAGNYEITTVNWTWQPGQTVANPADQEPGYYCQMLSADDKIWYVTEVLPVEGALNLATYNSAWAKYVSTTLKLGPYFGRGGCESGPMKNERQARAARKEQLNGTAGEKIFEVDWRYTPGQEAAPPSSAAPPPTTAPTAHAAPPAGPAPKPQEIAYFCQSVIQPGNGQGPPTYYLTGAFSSATPLAAINQAWQQHVVDAWHPGGQARSRCIRLSPYPAAQQGMINAITNAARGSKAQLIKVDWRP